MELDFTDPVNCCRVVSLFYGIGSLITFAEKLSILRDYGTGGWHAWDIFRLDRDNLPMFAKFPQLTGAAFDKKGIAYCLTGGLLGVAFMCLSPVLSWPYYVGVVLTFASSSILNIRDLYGGDGSQQMNTLVGAALFLGFSPWRTELTQTAALVFIAAQACLAYFTSGVAKVVSPMWRRGDALRDIMTTKSYGSEFAARMIRAYPVISRQLCRITVCMEVIFPVLLIGPQWLLIALFIWGFAFHVANAFLMGLNTFLWAFIATYPALYYTWALIHH